MSARRHWHTLFSAKTVCSRQRRNQKLQPNTTYIHKHTHTPIYGYERVREQSQETKQYKLHIYFQINLACMCMYIHFIYYYIYTYIYIYTRILVPICEIVCLYFCVAECCTKSQQLLGVERSSSAAATTQLSHKSSDGLPVYFLFTHFL